MILYEDSDFSYETRIGTMPYLAPEYVDSGEVSPKSDCYSSGIILLHLITGLRSTDPLFGEQSIVKWVTASMLLIQSLPVCGTSTNQTKHETFGKKCTSFESFVLLFCVRLLY